MNNTSKKLSKDGSLTRRDKINLMGVLVGAFLLLIGLALLGIKAVSVEYIDAKGILHENFFLLPIAFLFIISGVITFLIFARKSLAFRGRGKKKQ